MNGRYYSLNEYLQKQFGEKVYKLALDGGMTCPNRDGTLDTRGCIFCSAGGSGDFAEPSTDSIAEQIERAKRRIADKTSAKKFIAYFQSYTNTYAPVARLRQLFTQAIMQPEIAALSVATAAAAVFSAAGDSNRRGNHRPSSSVQSRSKDPDPFVFFLFSL